MMAASGTGWVSPKANSPNIDSGGRAATYISILIVFAVNARRPSDILPTCDRLTHREIGSLRVVTLRLDAASLRAHSSAGLR